MRSLLELAMVPEGRPYGIGLGFASVLVQASLGIKFGMAAISTAVCSSSTIRQKMDKYNWQTLLSALNQALAHAPLLAVFGLIQARGKSSDVVSFFGLGVACTSMFIQVLIVILVPAFGAEVPEVDRFTGDIITLSLGQSKWVVPAKMLSCMRALAEIGLIFGSTPASLQLFCASAFVRLSFAVFGIGSLGAALGLPSLGSFSEARADAEHIVSVAPILGGLALLDHIAWGSDSLLAAPLQPVVYCTLFAMAQVALIFVVRMALEAGVNLASKRALYFSFNLEEGMESRVCVVRQMTMSGFCLGLAMGIVRVVVGIFGVQVALSGITVTWREPLVACGTLMLAVHFAVLCMEYFVGKMADEVAKIENAPVEASASDEKPEISVTFVPDIPSETGEYLKALVLAFVAVHTALPPPVDYDVIDPDPFDFVVNFAVAPFRYGFLLAAVGVCLQVATLAFFSMSPPTSAAVVDCTGTMHWDKDSNTGTTGATFVQYTTLVFLELGLFLGCIGMGGYIWAPVFFVIVPLIMLLLPSESRQALFDVLSISTCIMGYFGSSVFAKLEAFYLSRRLASEAAASRRAELEAVSLETEMSQTNGAHAGPKIGGRKSEFGSKKKRRN
jgi:hypothetical protein